MKRPKGLGDVVCNNYSGTCNRRLGTWGFVYGLLAF